MTRARGVSLVGWTGGTGGEGSYVALFHLPGASNSDAAVEFMRWRMRRKAVVIREEKRASRMSGEGSGLGLGWVRKNKMIFSAC